MKTKLFLLSLLLTIVGTMQIQAYTVYYYNTSNYKFAVWSWADGVESQWSDWMTPVSDHSGWYKTTIRDNCNMVIFALFSTSTTTPDWIERVSQTEDLTYDGVNAYYVEGEGWQNGFGDASGTCGENFTWMLDADGLLTISGSGDMECKPWNSIIYRNDIVSVVISGGVTSIGNGAFYNCSSLTSVTIPNSVTSIGERAFSGCSSLTSVTIPNSVTSIGEWAFSGCSGLTSVTIPNSVTSIGGGTFSGCSGLTSVTIPNSVTSIGGGTFSNCISLTSVTIPNSVTSIGSEAFWGCSGLKSVILGTSLKIIERSAFSNCSAIKTITCYSQRPPTVKENAFASLNYSTIVYVPADYLDTYKMHDAWGLYDVRPLGAKNTQTDNVQITPQENTADIVWPAVSGAATYELVIKDKQGNIICTLIFNAQGQLTQLVFHAPAANGKQMPEQTMAAGFSFTITGLNQGTTYNYTITSKDVNGNVLDTKSGTFTTNGATGIEDVIDTQHLTHPTKVLIDGAVYIIMPDGRRYNLQGAEVR